MLIGIVLLTSILMTTIVHSAFSTQLQIKGEAIVRSDNDIRITNVKVIEQTNGAYETYNNKYTKDTTSMFVTLPPNSSIIYEIEISNKSNLLYYLTNIIEENNSGEINYEILNYEIGDYFENNSINNIKIKVSNSNFDKIDSSLILKFDLELDTELPKWEIENASYNSVLTTDTYKIKLIGTDNYNGISSSLKPSDITYNVGGVTSFSVKSNLSLVSLTDKKVVYELEITMLGNDGPLKINISNSTLFDKSGNKNSNQTLNTNITIIKNSNPNILILFDAYNNITSELEHYYSNIIVNDSLDISEINANEYDLVVYSQPYGAPSSVVNDIFNKNMNLLTQGDDTNSNINILSSFIRDYENGATGSKLIENKLTNLLPNEILFTNAGGRNHVKFRENSTVLYSYNLNSEIYDFMGYYIENNATWFHIQAYNNLEIYYIPIIEFIYGNKE